MEAFSQLEKEVGSFIQNTNDKPGIKDAQLVSSIVCYQKVRGYLFEILLKERNYSEAS